MIVVVPLLHLSSLFFHTHKHTLIAILLLRLNFIVVVVVVAFIVSPIFHCTFFFHWKRDNNSWKKEAIEHRLVVVVVHHIKHFSFTVFWSLCYQYVVGVCLCVFWCKDISVLSVWLLFLLYAFFTSSLVCVFNFICYLFLQRFVAIDLKNMNHSRARVTIRLFSLLIIPLL